MKPFFVICLECHHARTWSHRDDVKCPKGCEIRYSMPWNDGYGPDKKPIIQHSSEQYGDVVSFDWAESQDPEFYVHNLSEMKQKCQ